MKPRKMHPKSVRAWEGFQARISDLGGEVIEPEWLGNGRKHRCLCVNGHECTPRPADISQGVGPCAVCAGNSPVAAEEKFRVRVEELGGRVIEPAWLGVNKPHQCVCVNGHNCAPRPADVNSRARGLCRTCAGNDPAAAEAKFRARVEELGGTVLEREWLGANAPHRCVCGRGHDCAPHPGHIQQGGGICAVCAGNDPVAAEAVFRKRVANLGGSVVEKTWQGVNKPHVCVCVNGHDCAPYPSELRRGGGMCGTCKGHAHDVFYVVRNESTVKFGITCGDPKQRLGTHKSHGLNEVLRVYPSLPAGRARWVENQTKLWLFNLGAESLNGSKEYFDSRWTDQILWVADNYVEVAQP